MTMSDDDDDEFDSRAGVQNIVTIVIIVTFRPMRRGLAERNSTF